MFLTNGKSLFNNIGLIISIIILLILLIFSYNSCNKINENFFGYGDVDDAVAATDVGIVSSDEIPDVGTGGTAVSSDEIPVVGTGTAFSYDTKPVVGTGAAVAFDKPNTYQEPQNARISIKDNSVTIAFSINITNNVEIPKKFIVVLAQYDHTYKNTGNNKVYLSNEYELNMSVSTSSETTNKTNLCTLLQGVPSCTYTFNNIDTMDENGKIYYYKIGISSVYDTGNSRFVIPYNINTDNKLFNLNTSVEQQNKLVAEFNKFKEQQNIQSKNYSNTMSTADGQYEFIKSQLGNYPSNLVMDPTSELQNSLSDIVDKSLAQGILNINVKTSSPQPVNTI